jgi:hypothetical protein
MHQRLLLLPALLASAVLAPRQAAANERHLTYTYETGVLPQGAKELEVWTTTRFGRHSYFAAFDQRLEFEVGLTNKLQTSIYLNLSAVTAESMGVKSSELAFGGVSSEWKYKFCDPVADAIGFAGYGELTASPNFYEVEGKLIFDKVIGRTLLAANIVGAYEKEIGATSSEPEVELEVDLAATFFVTPRLSLGLEVRNHNKLEEAKEWQHSSLYAGPVLAYATDSWWVALSVLPQLPAIKKAPGEVGARVLDDGEKLNARLLFSFRL